MWILRCRACGVRVLSCDFARVQAVGRETSAKAPGMLRRRDMAIRPVAATPLTPLLALLLTLLAAASAPVHGDHLRHTQEQGARSVADAGKEGGAAPLQPRPRLAHLGSLLSHLEDVATVTAPALVESSAALAPPLGQRGAPAHSHAHSHAHSPAHALPSPRYPPPDADHDSDSYEDDDDYDFDEDYGDVDADMDDVDVDDMDLDEDMDDEERDVSWEHPQGHQPRGMSPVSKTKWDTMGTRSGVDELRRARIAAGASKTLTAMPGYTEAVDHLLRVNRDGDCKVPKPRLVQVKHEYPHPSKVYLPRCTILHQCGDDTGCCNAESLTCVPRQAHRVDLFFYTSTVGTSGPSSLQRVERLSFYNHTECGCVDRNSELLSRDRAQALRKNSRGLFVAPFQPRSERAPQPTASCRCPSKYAVRPGHDGSCTCDCFDKHRECLRLKKGKEYFNTHDRQCIQKSECKLPACEFGSYLRLAGRCPKKRERFEAWNQ